jgi:hypothetical protein
MTSQQQEGRIVTSCNECCFYKNGDCADGRIKKYHSLGKVEYSDPHIITGRCNLKRTKEWGNETGGSIEIAKRQVMPTFGISIININDDFDIKTTVEDLLKIDYDTSKVSICITTNKERPNEKIHYYDILKKHFPKSRLIITFEKEKYHIETESFQTLFGVDYFVSLNPGGTVNPNLFKTIDKIINEDLENYAYYEFDSGGGEKSSVIFSRVVRASYLDYYDYKLMESKLSELTKQKSLYRELNEK